MHTHQSDMYYLYYNENFFRVALIGVFINLRIVSVIIICAVAQTIFYHRKICIFRDSCMMYSLYGQKKCASFYVHSTLNFVMNIIM